ncbi:uncharacterized protein LOC129618340 [Condylostylus longicornis]|uniref:uncharacterized protein LOC129618340 n=1 Tax=Condylostylus longicornis TaxID=2530218 RepID=UPI00244E5198|nr:uncharacterized protein LOC129618340 [Condylostylus longicornis]
MLERSRLVRLATVFCGISLRLDGTTAHGLSELQSNADADPDSIVERPRRSPQSVRRSGSSGVPIRSVRRRSSASLGPASGPVTVAAPRRSSWRFPKLLQRIVNRKHSPVSSKESLSEVAASPDVESSVKEEECSICLSPMTPKTTKTLKCKHAYHKECFKKWDKVGGNCPQCRVMTKRGRQNDVMAVIGRYQGIVHMF